MKIKEFRTKYPQYNDLDDATLTKRVNDKRPGLITIETDVPSKRIPEFRTAKPVPHVSKFDPRRLIPGFAHAIPESPSDIGKVQAAHFMKTQVPESEAREIVNLALPHNPTVKKLRGKFPEYDDMDDMSFMDAVTTRYPEYTDVLEDLKISKEKLYKVIDRIEYKKTLGASLNADEAYINAIALPEDKGRVTQQYLLSWGNMMSFGAQNYVLNKFGFDQVQPESGLEKVAAGVGSLVGFINSPLKLASRIITRVPGLNRIFLPINASSKAQVLLKPMMRSAVTLGTAEALLLPKNAYKDGIIQGGERVEAFGGGFMFGAGLGSLGYIPNRAARMISSSLFMGLPSTLRQDTLEEQVFNFGFGAYHGIHGYADMIKSEDAMRQVIEKGVTNPRGREQLFGQGEDLLSKWRRMSRAEGPFHSEIIDAGRNLYTPLYDVKLWRKNTIRDVKVRLKDIRSERTFPLRNDKISRLYEQLKGKKVQDLTTTQLYNLQEHIRTENTPLPPSSVFVTRPPAKPGMKGKHISMWQNMFRLGYRSLEHMGFGDMFDSGVTNQVFKSDVKASQTMLLHRELTNTWKKIVGLNKNTSRRIFLDGPDMNLKKLAENHPEYKKELRVSNQVSRYFDILLDLQNRHRARYGKDPIKPLSKYRPHLFDAVRKAAYDEKFAPPDYFADIMEFTPPKEANQPYLKPRRGATGYKENIWAALDAYGFRSTDYVSDDGLRQVHNVIDWLGKEMKSNERAGKTSPIDLMGIKTNLRGWADRYAGRPGKIDTFIKNAAKDMPAPLKPYFGNLERISGIWRTITYTGAMGWRPKLALRNLGQHSLIIGEVGPKRLWNAITTRNTNEAKQALSYSDVLKTRELGFAPEVPYGLTLDTMESLRRGAFTMFRTADRINVEDAFLAGYLETTKGKYVKSGTDLHKKAVRRGDSVAALTQFMYTKGNRGPISNLWGLSSSIGKVASMFTTWPINKIELDIAWSREGQRHKLVRYLGVVGLGALTSIASNGKIRSSAYTGFGAEAGLLRKINDGIISIKSLNLIPRVMIGEDIKKGIDDNDLWRVIMYDVKKNAPFWEQF